MYNKTNNVRVLPPNIPNHFSANKKRYELTPGMIQDLAKTTGEIRFKIASKILSKYNVGMSDPEQLEKISDRLSRAYSRALGIAKRKIAKKYSDKIKEATRRNLLKTEE